ncbi:MAG: XRE family transcriptional regulator [uncultured bacterium]|nr:MAG: XRE family transcriptional regulator [uncultured bacterium]
MADIFTFRQKPIAAFLAALRITARPPENAQEAKSTMDAPTSIPEDEKARQSDENCGLLSDVGFESDDEAPALPVFDSDLKRDQACLVQTIGTRMREARELCDMSQSVAAKRLGYSNPSMLSMVEWATDRNSVPLWLIVRAARLYDVSIDFLFGATDDFEVGLQRGVQTWLIGEWEKSRIEDMKALEKLHRRVAAVSALLPVIADESERTAEAIRRFAEINPGFDDMRGGARLAAAAESLIRHAAKANSTAQRFRVEIGVDRSNQPNT